MDDFLTALRGGDLDRSDRLLDTLPENLPDQLILGVAELHMQRERWGEAEAALARLRRPTPDVAMRRQLCANLASLREHRPEIYKAIADADPGKQYSIVESRLGPKTIAFDTEGGRKTILSAENDPTGSVKKILQTIHGAQQAGKTLALAGIGDGYLLAELARNAPDLFLGRQQRIYLLEPDPRLVLACLMIHDFTGPSGPIEQQRFVWSVGPNWGQQLRDRYLGDLFLTYPQLTLRLGLGADEIEKGLLELLKELGALDKRLKLQAGSYYQHLSREELVDVFGERPHRKPRVMVITTRFSTVLQHSSRDVVDAMGQLGWETLFIIEPTPAHGINRLAMRDALARFRPDLVFQIDHLRHEWGDLMPANLPSICWIQDHLPNLTSAAAGRGVQSREFVLIPSVQRYVSNFEYPAENCLEFRKLTRVPDRPARWTSDADDLVYVSNWSQRPEAIAADVVRDLSRLAPADLIAAVCRRMIEIYGQGQCLQTPGDVRRALEEIQAKPVDEQTQLAVITALFERMNNVLYRQQGLAWVAEIVEKRGLKLAIYGNGWEDHPLFARYARGCANYGADLEELSRRSKINLVLEPYVCVTHQRMLDYLVAGGFVLSREHPQTQIVQGLIDLLAEGNASARDLDELLERSRRADATPGRFDPVQTLRALQAAGFLPDRGPILPRMADTTFNSRDELGEHVDRFLADPDSRRSIAVEQCSAVEDRYSYKAGMKRLIEWVRARLAGEQVAIKLAA